MESNQRVARLNVRLALLCIRVCPPTILYTTLYAIPAITPPQLSRRRSHVIDEWQMHLNKSIAGIVHCKYPALVLLSNLASLQPPFNFSACCSSCQFKCDLWPDTFLFNLFHSAHRRRRCGVGCRGCCRGENHLRMPAPPVRCRLLALEYKPRSPSPARPPRRHDFARHRTDIHPLHSGHIFPIWGLCGCRNSHKNYS